MIIETTETKKAICIKISFEKDIEFDINKENVHGWVSDIKHKELNDSSIYDFVKNNYNKD